MEIIFDSILNYAKENGASCVWGGYVGTINGFSSSNNPKESTITWVKNLEKTKELMERKPINVCIIAPLESQNVVQDSGVKDSLWIFCDNPKRLFFSLLEKFFSQQNSHHFQPDASSVILSKKIGDHFSIGKHCFIGESVEIGDHVTIHHNVTIEGKVRIGNNTIIHSGVVIGSDGFGYYEKEDGSPGKVIHFGGVIIGNHVEIGANTCIDRGTLEDTIINDNVKIDNLCHIGHNCIIEENVYIIALSMLGGSSILKKDSYIAPGSMIKNQITVGENALVGMGAVVLKNVDEKSTVAGVPAKPIPKK